MPTFAPPRTRQIAYWITTTIVALETSLGGIMDLMRTEHVRLVVSHLGYPLYLLTLLGLWKIPAGIVLLIRRCPRLRTWAYAGIFFEMTGAAFSHAIFHDTAYVAITSIFALLTLASWVMQPLSRPSVARNSIPAVTSATPDPSSV